MAPAIQRKDTPLAAEDRYGVAAAAGRHADTLVEEKLVIVGGAQGITVKFVELVPVPPGLVTVMVPVSAPGGTVAVSFLASEILKVAETPPKVTEVAPVKFVP